MLTLTAQQPLSLILFKKKPYGQHRFYVKEDPYYRYTKMFLTRLGVASVGLALIISGFFTALTLFFL
jgi:hypothetical protein